ncbi:DUF2218 domain-containing protein [Planobispora siamensis]|nr:DUF2218 domain-containing protein [Planobispora siamensis]
MPSSTAHVETPRPERYIKQLISHMSHRATAELADDGRGTITFAQGTCVLIPSPGRLSMTATAGDLASLTGVQDVVTRHLLGFASQEELSVEWAVSSTQGDVRLVDPVVGDYLLAHCTPADELLRELAAETRAATGGSAGMQVSHDEGVLLTMLARMTGARRAVEIGVFTGYSSICIARALPADGRLIACDISTEWTSIARRYWERAGVADRIDLRIAPAIETLRALPAEADIDFAFIDADKTSYPAYYEELVPRMRPGGLIVLDNVFLGGRVFDPAFQDESSAAMRRVNEIIVNDERVDSVMLPVRDGVTLARRR